MPYSVQLDTDIFLCHCFYNVYFFSHKQSKEWSDAHIRGSKLSLHRKLLLLHPQVFMSHPSSVHFEYFGLKRELFFGTDECFFGQWWIKFLLETQGWFFGHWRIICFFGYCRLCCGYALLLPPSFEAFPLQKQFNFSNTASLVLCTVHSNVCIALPTL